MRKTKQLSSPSMLALMAVFFCLFSSGVWAQRAITVHGYVLDNQKEPIVGATVVAKNTSKGTATDLDGKYTLTVLPNAVLRFSYVGYITQEVAVKGRDVVNVTLLQADNVIDDVVVIGYGTQKKASLTGAVAGVRGKEMIRTKNENPQNMLTGRVAGLRVWQKSSEPGSFNNTFDIRGMGTPLVVIDGVPRTIEEFQRLNANDIEDVSILKDASAAIYGVRAANGVVLVTTKKGEKGKSEVHYNGSFTFQTPSNMPTLADPYQTMTLYNERAMNDVNGGTPVYTQKDFEAFQNGTRRTTNWTDLLFSDVAPQTQHDLSLSGGNDRMTYYVSLGYFFQEGFFKSGDLNYDKYNLKSSLSAKVVKGVSFDLNINGISGLHHTPYCSSVDIIRNYWRQGVLYPAYADPDNKLLNYEGLDLEENTIAKMSSDISGYHKYKEKFFQSSVALNFDFGAFLPQLNGLTGKAMFSYDFRLDDNESYRKEYSQYAYNKQTDSYTQKLYNSSSPSQLRRENYSKQQVLGQFTLNYDRTFQEDHKVGALIGWEVQKRTGDNFYAQRNLAFNMPYLFAGTNENQFCGMQSGTGDIYELTYEALIGRVNYAYGNRYLLEGQFRYDGSSKFASGHQWGFFPSLSAGWRISEEPFFRHIDALSFVNQLKLRASYGVLGDDGDLLYDWAMGYTYPSTSRNAENGYYSEYAPGYLIGDKFVYGVTPLALPNEDITWFTSHTFDIGIDFEAWNGLFGVSFDYFNRYRKGCFARRSGNLPTVVGAMAPRENLDSDRQIGLDLQLTHRNTIGNFSYNVKGIATITRQKYLTASEKGPYGNSYDRWRNDNLTHRFQGVQFGYTSAGRYQNWTDIWSYPIYKERDVLPGDYKYEDWNGDGEINSLDEHPYAFDQTPWLNYSLSFDGSYHNFDLSILLQGSALGSMQYREPLYSIWGSNGGGTLTQYTDRWHPVDPASDPYSPSTQWVKGYYGFTGHYPYENSEFNRVSTAYLRLKSIELGYTLPRIPHLNTLNLRVFANAYNVFTITGVKFVDPEHPDDELGRMYPLNKTYTLGLQLSF